MIPRTLAQNCGTNVLRALTQLRAKHASGKEPTWGINGETGALVDMNVRAGAFVLDWTVCMPPYPVSDGSPAASRGRTPTNPTQELGVWEPYAVKVQTIKTAIEVRSLVWRDMGYACNGSKRVSLM